MTRAFTASVVEDAALERPRMDVRTARPGPVTIAV
jgi:hypothetical protein